MFEDALFSIVVLNLNQSAAGRTLSSYAILRGGRGVAVYMFTDAEIQGLIYESKQLNRSFREMMRLKAKPGHFEYELDITGARGSDFRLVFRQSAVNKLDFSVILALRVEKTNQLFRLRRYNGKSHEHTNHIEHETFYGFHIHYATERYQQSGWREDGYAELTHRYNTFEEAIGCMITDCGFGDASAFPNQQALFGS